MSRALRCALLLFSTAVLAAGLQVGSAVAQTGDPEWLQWLNYHRAVADLDPVTHNADFDASVMDHARYLIELDQVGLCDGYPHCQAIPPGTPLGDEGARNIISRSSAPLTEREVVENLMAAPFHAMSMLRPGLTEAGFAIYTNVDAAPWSSAGLVNTSSDPSPTDDSRVVTWPADGAVSTLLAYSGNEVPDPLAATSCASLSFDTDVNGAEVAGLPIIVQHATVDDVEAVIVNESTGEQLESCTAQPDDFDSGSVADLVLRSSDAFLVIPRDPLEPDTSYTVTVTGALDLQFTFSTVVAPDDPPSSDDAIPAGTPIMPVPDSTPDSVPPTSEPGPAVAPDPTIVPVPSSGVGTSSFDLGWVGTALKWLPMTVGVGLVMAATLQAGRQKWTDAQSSATAVLGVGVALITPMFFVWGVTRVGRTETLYRGVDLLGVAVLSGLLVVAIIGAALVDLSAARGVSSVAKGALVTLVAVASAMVAASELIGGVGFVAGTSRRFGADASVGPGPWTAIVLGGIGLIWAFVPAQGAVGALLAPFRRLRATGPAVALGLLTVSGLALIVVARYLPWVEATAFGEAFDVRGRSVPVVGSSAMFGLLLVLAALACFGARRPVAGLLVGGTGSMLVVFPAGAAVVVSDQIVNSDVTVRVVDLAQRRFSVLEPSLVVSVGPWMTFVGGLCCALAVIALGWSADVTDE